MLTYDITFQKFRCENGLYAKDHKPRLVYGTRPVIDIQLQSNGRAFDAAGVSAWTCAVAQDHLVSTVPIARTTSGITKTANSAGAVLHIPIDLLTNQAKTYLDGSKEKECYFGISGLDSNGRLVCYVEFVVTLEFQVDPEGTGTVQPVTVTSLTQAQVEAIAAGKAQNEIQSLQNEIEASLSSAISSAQQAKSISQSSATEASSAKDAAVSAKNDSVSAKNDSVSAKNLSVSAKNDAVNAKDAAVAAKTAAEAAASSIVTSVQDAIQAKDAAVSAKNDSVSAKNDSVSAKNLSVSAKNDAVNAKDAAVAAKTAAEAAKTSAETAASSASTDASTATQAKDSAVSAKTAAESAKTAAEAAKASAESAKESAETAASSIGTSVQAAEAAKTVCQELKSQTQAIYDSFIAINTFMVGHAHNYGVTVSGTQVSICWTDPSNIVTQELATIAFWQKTRLIYKVGGFPANENDGVVLVDSTVRDQYRETPFTYDMGVTSNYYFALFTCTTGGVWNTTATAPRFTTDVLTWATIAMMTRANTLLQYPGMAIGSVVDIQVNSIYPKLRYKLAHVNYKAHHLQVSDYHYDHTKIYNSIWIPNYLPCIGESNDAHMLSFDAQELSYAQTWDEVFITGKAYYKIVDGSYVQMTEGTDYDNGENIAAWSATEGIAAYTKNHSNRVSNGCNSWKDSNLRQWLNATGSGWFSKQNEYDVIGNQGASGWLTGFDQGFLNLIMPVYNKTARNTISAISGGGGGGFDITLDKFWVPSMKEFQNSNTNSIAEGAYWDYFSQVATTAESRIQRDEGGTSRIVWLRSANTGITNYEYYITTSGSSNSDYANLAFAFLPAMCIA